MLPFPYVVREEGSVLGGFKEWRIAGVLEVTSVLLK